MSAPVASATSVNSSGLNGRRARRRGKPKVQWKAYLYILPAFVLFAVFLGVPALQTAQFSLYKWNGIGPSTWVGLQNYADLFSDTVLRSSFLHAGVLVVFYSVIPVVLALVLTSIIARGANLKGMSLFRTLLFLPQVVASVVVATVWSMMLDQNWADLREERMRPGLHRELGEMVVTFVQWHMETRFKAFTLLPSSFAL